MLIEEGRDYVLPSGVEPPYRSIKNLGYGNSGTIDKVEDINTGIVYARKTIRLHTGPRKAERRRIFDNEAKVIRDLATHHQVFATYYDDPDVCLIMHPVADSGDLETFLQGVRDEIEECSVHSERRPDEIKVSTLERAFGCLANGLACMHKQRIRQKDIKSKNILVHQGNVVYTDFGISGNFSQADSSTTEGPPTGLTRRYSAPEVIEQEPRNSSSDVYSLGCVFIEILSALTASFTVDFRTPYCDGMERLRTAIESCTLSGIRQDLAGLAITMTRKEKNQRPTSFQVWTKLRGYSCAQCVSQYLLEGVQLTSVGVADGESVNWEWDEARKRWYYYDCSLHCYVYQNGAILSVTNQNNMQLQAASDAKHNALHPQNSEQSSGPLHFASAFSNHSVDDDRTLVQSSGVTGIDNAQPVDNRVPMRRTAGYHAHSPSLSNPQYEASHFSNYRNPIEYSRQMQYPQQWRTGNEMPLRVLRSDQYPHTMESTNTYNLPKVQDPPTFVQDQGHLFFRVGVVFRALWPELSGNANNLITTNTSGLLGDKFFVKIRRFIVIREGNNSCTCLSIQTYHGRGVTQTKTKSQHAIVYTGPVPPPPLEYEIPNRSDELPMGPPIRVLRLNPQDKMDPTSRVNFSKLYTVEHNAKVAKFGYVDPNDLSILISQFEKNFLAG